MFNRPLEHRQLAGISAPATSCLTNAELQRTRRHVRAAQPARNSILLSHAHSPQSFVFKAALTPRKAQVSCNPLQQVLFFFFPFSFKESICNSVRGYEANKTLLRAPEASPLCFIPSTTLAYLRWESKASPASWPTLERSAIRNSASPILASFDQ